MAQTDLPERLKDFALSRYQREGVAEFCLRLQRNAGADVNMLLTAAWLAERGQCWQAEQIAELIEHCREWRERCVLPLRDVREFLKGHALYDAAKALEIDAEIHQLHLLEEALQHMAFANRRSPIDALKTNLTIYFECIAPHRSVCEHDLNPLIDAFAQKTSS